MVQKLLSNLRLISLGLFLMVSACMGADSNGLGGSPNSNRYPGAPIVPSKGGQATELIGVDIPLPVAKATKGYVDPTSIRMGTADEIQDDYADVVNNYVEENDLSSDTNLIVAQGTDGEFTFCIDENNCSTEQVVDGWFIKSVADLNYGEAVKISYATEALEEVAIKVTLNEPKPYLAKTSYTVDISTSIHTVDAAVGISAGQVMFNGINDNNELAVMSVPVHGGVVESVIPLNSPLHNIKCAQDMTFCMGYSNESGDLVRVNRDKTTENIHLTPFATSEFAISPDGYRVAQEARTTFMGKQYSRIAIGYTSSAYGSAVYIHQNNRQVLSRSFIWNDEDSLIVISHYGNGDYNLEYLSLTTDDSIRVGPGVFLLSPVKLYSSTRPIANLQLWNDHKITYECTNEAASNVNICVFNLQTATESVLVKASSLGLGKNGVKIAKHQWNADHTIVIFDIRPYKTEAYTPEDYDKFLLGAYNATTQKNTILKEGFWPYPHPITPNLAAYVALNENGKPVIGVLNLKHYPELK
ncbi:hypothetical protein K1X76_06830 [bacterium]|nr:hypothetical protein [bacterium]